MRPAWEFGIEKDSLEEEKTDGGGGGANSGLLSTTPSRVF